jgi:hypothetical protein
VNHLLGIRFFFLIDWLEEYWLKESVGPQLLIPGGIEIRTLRFEEKDIRRQFDKDAYPFQLTLPQIQTSF